MDLDDFDAMGLSYSTNEKYIAVGLRYDSKLDELDLPETEENMQELLTFPLPQHSSPSKRCIIAIKLITAHNKYDINDIIGSQQQNIANAYTTETETNLDKVGSINWHNTIFSQEVYILAKPYELKDYKIIQKDGYQRVSPQDILGIVCDPNIFKLTILNEQKVITLRLSSITRWISRAQNKTEIQCFLQGSKHNILDMCSKNICNPYKKVWLSIFLIFPCHNFQYIYIRIMQLRIGTRHLINLNKNSALKLSLRPLRVHVLNNISNSFNRLLIRPLPSLHW